MTTEVGGSADVGRREDPQHVAVREQQYIGSHRRELGEQYRCTRGYLDGRFAAQRAVGEYVPSGPFGANLGTRPPFVVAVVHLEQEVGRLHHTPEPREFGGASCALQRARHGAFEAERGEPRPKRGGLALARLGQRDVRPSGVASAVAPRRSPMAHENNAPSHVSLQTELAFGLSGALEQGPSV